MSEANKALARRIVEEIVNQGNFSVMDELIAPDYVYYEPTVGSVRGRDGLRSVISMYRSALPDVKMTIDEQIGEGDTVVTRWTAQGTHRGELMGVAPTGREVRVQGIIISRFQNGQVIEDFESYDVHGMLQQLGVLKGLAKTAA